MISLNQLYNMDCLDALRQMPDNFVDLACVDPPYGIHGISNEPWTQAIHNPRGQKTKSAFCGAGKLKNRALNKEGNKVTSWDVAPEAEYFSELFRVSRHQIIWGGNYFNLPPCRGFIIWDKMQPWNNFSACEFAWTSFDVPSKIYRERATAAIKAGSRIHPTQKPVSLYDFCLKHFAKFGDTILDTHAGSGACIISAHKAGLSWLGFEIDQNYYLSALKRLDQEIAQGQLFNPAPGAV